MPTFNRDTFLKIPVIGILRRVAEADVGPILNAYYEAGFNTIEITMDTLNAESIIADAISEYGEKLNIGAGTVLDENDLEMALNAGAQFIVTPVVNESVIRRCVKFDIPVFPGAYTPTEIFNAWNLGATMVKVFPTGSAGAEYIKALKGPFKNIKLLPTGGIDIGNVKNYMQAGAQGVGVATGLFKSDLINKKDWPGLTQHLNAFRAQLNFI